MAGRVGGRTGRWQDGAGTGWVRFVPGRGTAGLTPGIGKTILVPGPCAAGDGVEHLADDAEGQ